MTSSLEIVDPREVGMDHARLGEVDNLVEAAIAASDIPGAVVLIARFGKVVKHTSYGMAMEVPERRPMSTMTIFDLASLTKVVVTVPLTLMLAERGFWCLQDPVSRFLPQLRLDRVVTIWHLLTHTAGLPAWANLFWRGQDRDKVLQLLFEDRWPVLRLVHDPGARVTYSDLGYILLGLAIEAVTGQPLDNLAREWIFTPLEMQRTMFNPLASLALEIAATEEDLERGGVLTGVVHDENAWAMEGVSGHAGLFGCALDLARYAQMLLDGGRGPQGRVLSRQSIQLMISPHTEGLNERRGLGWLLQSPRSVSAGEMFSPQAFGHTGFTGTSLWADPTHALIVVLLTNRVHPSRNRGALEIQRLRALVHNATAGAIVNA